MDLSGILRVSINIQTAFNHWIWCFLYIVCILYYPAFTRYLHMQTATKYFKSENSGNAKRQEVYENINNHSQSNVSIKIHELLGEMIIIDTLNAELCWDERQMICISYQLPIFRQLKEIEYIISSHQSSHLKRDHLTYAEVWNHCCTLRDVALFKIGHFYSVISITVLWHFLQPNYNWPHL